METVGTNNLNESILQSLVISEKYLSAEKML